MEQVQALKVEREKLEKEITSKNMDVSSDFLSAMVDCQLLPEEQISTAKLKEIYGPLKQEVEASVKKQETLQVQIEQCNRTFGHEKSGSTTGVQRENMMKMLASAHDTFVELKSNLQEGTKFYNDLTPLLVRLQQKVSDFCFARQTEKEDLMRQLQQNIVAQSNSNAAPPPRPPPPNFNAGDGERPISPPRNVAPLHGAVDQTNPFSQPAYAPPYPQQAQQPFVQYGYANPPQFQQNFSTPYPLSYPGTYPGAFQQFQPHPQPQGYGNFPPRPNWPQQ